MGNSNSNRTKNLIQYTIPEVPIMPQGVKTGQQINHYYENKHRFTQVSLFTNGKFDAKINSLARNENQKNYLWGLANKVNEKMQRSFEASA